MPDHTAYKTGQIASCLWGEWIAIAAEQEFEHQTQRTTQLDGHIIIISKLPQASDVTSSTYQVSLATPSNSLMPKFYVEVAYGFVWLSIGQPKKPLFDLAEYHVDQARKVPCGAYGVRTSPLRAIENFLDMAHFPYVHTGILGAEPETAVQPYHVEIREDKDEIWATECFFTQPLAAPSSPEPQQTEYLYRVVSPLNAILYKVNTAAEGVIPADVICLFIQPVSETQVRAHLMMVLDDQTSTMQEMFLFQQTIFTQDKPILENHVPLKLPLTKLEIPTKADALASTYRKWLIAKAWTYGACQNVELENA